MEYLDNTEIRLDKILVVSPSEGALTAELEKKAIPFKILPYQPNVEKASVPFFKRQQNAIKRLKTIYYLYKEIKKRRPALLYSNSSVIYYGFFLSKLLHIPHIWHLREYGLNDYQLISDFGFNFKKLILRLNTFNIAISQDISRHFNLNKTNSTVIYNGVIKKNKLNKDIKLPPNNVPLRFGVVGLIVPYKKQLDIIKIFQRYNAKSNGKNVLFIIGQGNPDYIKEIETYISINNLNSTVTLCGHIKNRDHIYDLFDILITGAEFEGFGRTTVEAMSYGKIPLGYNGGGTAEVIKDNVTGLLFNNYDELYALLYKLNNNRNYYESLSRNLLMNFEEKFTNEYYSQQIDKYVLSFLKTTDSKQKQI